MSAVRARCRRDLLAAARATAISAAIALTSGGTIALVPAGAAHAQAPSSGELPLRLLPTGDIGGLLAVDVTVDAASGRERGRWLIDTGSSRHLVSPAFARRHGLAERGRVAADTAFGRVAGPQVELPELALGPLLMGGATALVLDLRPLAGTVADEVDGVLGAPLLDTVTLELDLVRWTVRVGGDALARCPDGWDSLALERRRGVPVLALSVDGGPTERALLDTGNAAALVRIDGDDAPPRTGVPLPGLAAVLARAGRVALGALERTDVPVAHLRAPALRSALPPDVAALAGVALLDGARVQIGLAQRRLCVEPGTRQVLGGFGFTLDRQGDALVITAVLDDSPAHAAGLRAGDRVALWAGALPPLTVAHAWAAVRERETLALAIERAGGTRSMLLRRAHFLPRLAN